MKRLPAALAAAALLIAPAGTANAAPPTAGPTVWADDLVTPLHLSVGTSNNVYVSEEFVGELTRVTRGGAEATVVSEPGWDVAGSDVQGGTVYYVDSQGAGPDPRPNIGRLLAVDPSGNVRVITDQLAAYEAAYNPDQVNTYGLTEFNQACADELAALQPFPIPAQYTGQIDSHPYGVDVVGNYAYVADAGGNDVLKVNLTTGAISTLAVLPPRPVTIPQEVADAMHVPDCGGLAYGFEPVPTDVELAPDGWLYVSSLPGGPEGPELGARGAVFQVSPSSGAFQLYVEGLLGPTGIALDSWGNLYIAEMFGNRISVVPAGSHTASLFLEEPVPADVEVKNGTLYATVNLNFGDFTNPPAVGHLISLKL